MELNTKYLFAPHVSIPGSRLSSFFPVCWGRCPTGNSPLRCVASLMYAALLVAWICRELFTSDLFAVWALFPVDPCVVWPVNSSKSFLLKLYAYLERRASFMESNRGL